MRNMRHASLISIIRQLSIMTYVTALYLSSGLWLLRPACSQPASQPVTDWLNHGRAVTVTHTHSLTQDATARQTDRQTTWLHITSVMTRAITVTSAVPSVHFTRPARRHSTITEHSAMSPYHFSSRVVVNSAKHSTLSTIHCSTDHRRIKNKLASRFLDWKKSRSCCNDRQSHKSDAIIHSCCGCCTARNNSWIKGCGNHVTSFIRREIRSRCERDYNQWRPAWITTKYRVTQILYNTRHNSNNTTTDETYCSCASEHHDINGHKRPSELASVTLSISRYN